jgi:hypothetical protein
MLPGCETLRSRHEAPEIPAGRLLDLRGGQRPRPRQAVIAVSLWGLAGGESINFLRVFRAFRVMRLFKKLQSMRKILISLGACVKPVLSAFVILFILASVYAQVSQRRRRAQHPLPSFASGRVRPLNRCYSKHAPAPISSVFSPMPWSLPSIPSVDPLPTPLWPLSRSQVGYTFFGELRPEWFGCYSAAMITLTQASSGPRALFPAETALQGGQYGDPTTRTRAAGAGALHRGGGTDTGAVWRPPPWEKRLQKGRP